MSDAARSTTAEVEAKFRTIFESVADGIWVCDAATGRVTDANAAACAMFGFSRDELVGHTIGSLSGGGPHYSARDAALWLEQARVGQPQLFEWRCKAKDGHAFWAEVSLRCVPQGGAGGGGREIALAVLRDVTERKRKEDEIAQQAHIDQLTGLPNRRDFDDKLHTRSRGASVMPRDCAWRWAISIISRRSMTTSGTRSAMSC
jgi:PAS domain S-box-containing protein